MKGIFLYLLVIPFLPAYGQKTKMRTGADKLSIGFNFSPDYSFRTLNNRDGSSSAELVINSRNDLEIPKMGYTTGLNVSMQFSKRIGLETGIQYSGKGYKTKNQDLVFIPPGPSLPTKARFIYPYQYIGIPLRVKFTVGAGKVRFLPGLGIATNFLLNAKQTSIVEYADGRTHRQSQSVTSQLNKVDVSSLIALGVEYKMRNRIHLRTEPSFRYGWIATKDAAVKEHLWSVGLNFGIYYALE